MSSELSEEDQNKKSQPEHWWKPGQSGNPAGRPKGSVDPLKEIGRKIAEQRISSGLSIKQQRQLKKLGISFDDTSVLELIMTEMALSSNPAKIAMFLERTFGKVPNVNLNTNQNIDIVSKFKNKFTDSELESIAGGADALEILLAKLPDVGEE